MPTVRNQQFLGELAQFYRNKGQHAITPAHLISRINGKPVNLWDLYSSVLELGGSYKVNLHNRWDDIYAKLFHTLPQGANVSVALRQIYQRYLVQYEKANTTNFISESNDNDDEDSMASRDHGTNFIIHSSLNHSYGNQSSTAQTAITPNPINKLYCSLMSDLPNEMDFGLRVATILTNSKEIDHLADFKLIDVIIECSVMYACSCDNPAYSKILDHKTSAIVDEFEMLKALFQTTSGEQVCKLEITEPTGGYSGLNPKFIGDDDILKEMPIGSNHQIESVDRNGTFDLAQLIDRCLSANSFISYKTCDCYIRFWSQLGNDSKVLKTVFQCNDQHLNACTNVDQDEQTQQKNYYKVRRVAELIKNISYSIEKMRSEQYLDAEQSPPNTNSVANTRLEFASSNLLRFLLLLFHCNDQSLVNIALDITANISPLATAHISYTDQYANLLTLIYEWCVRQVLISQDLHSLNRCLEILAKLVCASYESINRLIISQVLQHKRFFTRLTELLTCQHDVGLLVSCLDCCLSLSENYPKMLIQDNHHLIKIIINLLNCDAAEFFTEEGMQRIKILDERKYPLECSNVNNVPPLLHVQPNAKIAINSSQLITENEQFAIQWLHSQYEPRMPHSATTTNMLNRINLKLNDMYNEYFKYNCRCGRKNLISSQAFGSVVKKAFPSVTFLVAGELDGIQLKTAPVTLTTSTAIGTGKPNANPLTSPILKAHLSSPPKSGSIVNVVTTSTNNLPALTNGSGTIITQTNSPIITTNVVSANAGTTSNKSAIIKNMLANKLRAGATQMTQLPSGQIVDSSGNPINIQLVSADSINKTAMPVTTMTTIQTGLPITSKATVGNNALMVAAPTATTNLITLPMQTGQSSVAGTPTGGVLLTTANHLQAGTAKLVPNPQQPHQFLLVRTIMAPQTNQMYSVPNSTGSVRLILPASVITKPMAGVSSTQVSAVPNLNAGSTMFAIAPTSNAVTTTGGILFTNASNTTASSGSLMFTTSNTCTVNSNFTVAPFQTTTFTPVTSLTAETTLKPTESPQSSTETNQTSVFSTTVNNDHCSTTDESPLSTRVNQVKSSPLLNVLLDKGKLPDFSTVASINTVDTGENGLSSKTVSQTSESVSSTDEMTGGDSKTISIYSKTNDCNAPTGDAKDSPLQVNTVEEHASEKSLVNGLCNDKMHKIANGDKLHLDEDSNPETDENVKRSRSDAESDFNTIDSLPKKTKLESTTINSITITPVNTVVNLDTSTATNSSLTNGTCDSGTSPAEAKTNVTIEKVTLTVNNITKPIAKSNELEYYCDWLNCNRLVIVSNHFFTTFLLRNTNLLIISCGFI